MTAGNNARKKEKASEEARALMLPRCMPVIKKSATSKSGKPSKPGNTNRLVKATKAITGLEYATTRAIFLQGFFAKILRFVDFLTGNFQANIKAFIGMCQRPD